MKVARLLTGTLLLLAANAAFAESTCASVFRTTPMSSTRIARVRIRADWCTPHSATNWWMSRRT